MKPLNSGTDGQAVGVIQNAEGRQTISPAGNNGAVADAGGYLCGRSDYHFSSLRTIGGAVRGGEAMRKKEMELIAARAARLAVCTTDDGIELDMTFEEYYQEYMDQLRNNDYQCLRMWIGWQIEEGSREAVEIMKMLIRSELQRAVG